MEMAWDGEEENGLSLILVTLNPLTGWHELGDANERSKLTFTVS